MPLFSVILGALFLISGFRGTAEDTFKQLSIDVDGFLALGAVIIILGVSGLSPTIRPISKGLLVLVFLVFILKNGNKIVENTVQTTKGN